MGSTIPDVTPRENPRPDRNGAVPRGFLSRWLRRSRRPEDEGLAWSRLALNVHVDLGCTGPNRTVLLTSPRSSSLIADVALNLARVLAEDQGRRVLIVDACFGRPRLTELFGAVDRPGFLNLLGAGSSDLGGSVVPTGHSAVDLLPRGSSTRSLGEILDGPDLAEVWARAREDHQDILINGPAVLDGSALFTLLPAVDLTLLVAIEDQTRLTDLDESQRLLDAAGASRIGLVMATPGP